MSFPAFSRPRRLGWWIFGGVLLGGALVTGLLLLPPVQGWLLRRALARQPDLAVDFGRVAVGPGGAEAANLTLRLPNLTLEARALRIAISPWQLLSRRRLAIADLQARELAIRASAAPSDAPAAPFTGILAGLRAPLAWACAKAEVDGVISLEQTGAAPLPARFRLSGADLDIARPGRLRCEFTLPGSAVTGFEGDWSFAGTLEFTPATNGEIDAVTITGQLSPARHAAWRLPAIDLRFHAARRDGGERYEWSVTPLGDHGGARLSGQAALASTEQRVTGSWEAHGGSALAAPILQRDDLPHLQTRTDAKFSWNTATGEATVELAGEFSGHDWQRFLPELAAIAPLHGQHTLVLQRRGAEWQLERLTARAASAGSHAEAKLDLTRPFRLPPGNAGDNAPWARLAISRLPLGWLAPVLEVARVEGGELAGSWTISSPEVTKLRFAPEEAISTTPFVVSDPTLPQLPAFTLRATAALDLTATQGLLSIREAAFVSPANDRLEGEIDATLDLEQLTAETSARWRAHLPTWLGGSGAPLIRGETTATVRENDATVHTWRAVTVQDERETFTAEALAPFLLRYENDTTLEAPEGDMLRLSAQGLRLDWAAPLLPGFSVSGVLTAGESVLRREGRSFALHPTRPWRFADLRLVQGGLPLLEAPEFEIAPEGTVQLDDEWRPRDFVADLQLSGRIAEIFRLRNPSGPLHATGTARAQRQGDRLELRRFALAVKRGDDAPVLDLETLQPIGFGATAKTNDIDQAPESVRLRTAAVPLAWLDPLLPPGWRLDGTLQPAEFTARIDLPNLFLQPTRPLAVDVARLQENERELLRDLRLELSPGVIVMGQFSSLVIEQGSLSLEGRDAGTAGVSLLYFTNNLTIPISASVDVGADLAWLRRQPVAATLPLPPGGEARFLLNHDLTRGEKSNATVLLSEVQAADGSGVLPRLGARLTLMERAAQNGVGRLQLEFQYQTAPVWSAFVAQLGFGMVDGKARLTADVEGEFFDVGRFLPLLELCTPAVPAGREAGFQSREIPAASLPPRGTEVPPPAPFHAGPFWETITGHFALKFGKVVHAPYVIDHLTGQFDVGEALELRELSGRMFEGDWRGQLRLGFDPAEVAAPYHLTGRFGIADFSAERIMEAAYPNELGSFSGRLNFDSRLEARGADVRQLLDGSTSEFQFHSEDGRLRLQVPHANLASAALLVGGTITFSPELRAIGRLVKQFSDLPVQELSARGRRSPDGVIALEDFRLHTPQLRLSGRAEVPAQPGVELAARTFELPVTLAVRDELAVLLRGMKLIDRQPGADGFFPMNRQPVLRGTLGAPDTTELYDTFAHAVAGSRGTFGFLMRKVQQEVAKAQNASRQAGGN